MVPTPPPGQSAANNSASTKIAGGQLPIRATRRVKMVSPASWARKMTVKRKVDLAGSKAKANFPREANSPEHFIGGVAFWWPLCGRGGQVEGLSHSSSIEFRGKHAVGKPTPPKKSRVIPHPENKRHQLSSQNFDPNVKPGALCLGGL